MLWAEGRSEWMPLSSVLEVHSGVTKKDQPEQGQYFLHSLLKEYIFSMVHSSWYPDVLSNGLLLQKLKMISRNSRRRLWKLSQRWKC
jgi:hypothetical protein